MLMSQALSEKVTSAPVPGVLLLQAIRRSKNDESWRVTVKESQADSAGREKNADGLPNAVGPPSPPGGGALAREFQRSQDLSGACMAVGTLGRGLGEEVLVPKEELDVMEPIVTRTMSAGSTWIIPGEPFLLKWISSTVIFGDSANESLVTFVSA
jgi:hypothetical protein